MKIYTIGHSNYSMERFLDMLRHYNINTVVDIRGTPYSKYNVQYDKEKLQETLRSEGFIYIYMAKEFAAKRGNKQSYNGEGYSNFEEVVKEKDFLSGIERLKVGCSKGYRIALLGAMQSPIRCHRCILLGRELIKAGFELRHILDDYSLATQEDMEKELLDKYFPNRNQLTIDELLGESMTEEEMINEGYRLANRKIGYRVEGIGKK